MQRVQPRVAPRRKPAPGTTPATRATETARRRSSESAPTPGLFYERRKIARWAPSEADVIRTGRAATAALPLWAMTTMESLMAHSASPSVHLHTRNVEVRSVPRTLRVWFTLLSCTASRTPLARPPALAPSLARSQPCRVGPPSRLPSRPDAADGLFARCVSRRASSERISRCPATPTRTSCAESTKAVRRPRGTAPQPQLICPHHICTGT